MARAPKGQGALPLPGRRSLPAYCPVRVLIDDFHHIRHLTAPHRHALRFDLCMPGCTPRHVCVAERRLLLTYLLLYLLGQWPSGLPSGI